MLWISICATVLFFLIARMIYRRFQIAILSPIFTTLLMTILFVLLFHVSYTSYMSGGRYLTYLLQPATVAFAIPLYKHFQLLKRHSVEILVSVIGGSMVAISSTVLLAHLFRLNTSLTDSLAPRSITTPFAMDVSNMIGGTPVLTAVFVILTALVGLLVGPIVIRHLRITSSLAKGTLLGTSAHAAGTSRAFEFGNIEGTFASISMILAAGFTMLIAPLLVHLLQVHL